MITLARRRSPVAINYRRRRGVWPGMGVFNPPARPDWIDPGYPPDAAIVAANTAKNDAYQVAVQQEQAGANFDQCAANAGNANSPEQYADVMSRCQQQAEIQSAPENPVVTYYTPPAASTPVTPPPAVPAPQIQPTVQQPAFTPPSPATVARPAFLAPVVTPAAAPVVTPAGQVVVTSSGAQTAPSVALPTVAGFNLSTIPWWGWAAAAGVALFAFGGGRGR